MNREVRLYLGVWAALLALLVLTVASSFVHLHGWNAAANLAIAGAKALLVATFFAILIGLSLADILNRGT